MIIEPPSSQALDLSTHGAPLQAQRCGSPGNWERAVQWREPARTPNSLPGGTMIAIS